MRLSWFAGACLCFASLAACGGTGSTQAPLTSSGGSAGSDSGGAAGSGALGGMAGSGALGGAAGAAGAAGSGASGGTGGAPATTKIEHVVIVVQENHTFDTYFGNYCTAKVGSNPTCTTGPACCEMAPATDPSGANPVVLDDAENAAYDPNHTQACELAEANGGLMNRYVTGTSCSNPKNFALAPASVVKPYHDLAASNALADRYFQPISGQSSSNDMYFAVAKEVFLDNAEKPTTNGQGCTLPAPEVKYQGETTIADLLLGAGHSFAFYAMGYHAMVAALLCPSPPSDCTSTTPLGGLFNPCNYDPSDVPFEYYAQFADNSKYMKDYTDLAKDIGAGALPNVAFVKATGYKNEHPGYGTTITNGVGFVSDVVGAVESSPYAASTLVLITWDEGGGFYDHVAPPGTSPVDDQPYGTRVPLLAVGPFARKNHVSHVTLEHSSIVKFLELNFLGQTGQLGARDSVVANLGSLLDPAQTGIVVPED